MTAIARRLPRPRPAVAWLATALGLSVLLTLGTDGGSALRVLDPLLLAAALAALVMARRRPPMPAVAGGRRLLLGCAAASWVAGMLVELSISADGTGFGGMHPDTRSSFLLAQGWYVPAALLLPLLVRRLRLDRDRALLVGAALALYEIALTAGPLLLSPAAPAGLLVAAYIAAVYAVITCAGVLLVDPRRLWDDRRPRATRRRALGIGAACGVLLWASFMGWATLLDAAGMLRPT